MTTADLFRDLSDRPAPVRLGDGAWLLPRFACDRAEALLAALDGVLRQAPLRHMQTPGGHTMTVAMSCCGERGWHSDAAGYRYTTFDPHCGRRWPPMPAVFVELAVAAAATAGYPGFVPDSCLINRYGADAKLSPHQDRDERDLSHPIVSLSLGLPARFRFGGPRRRDRLLRTDLEHGDVVVWGGASRLAYHGVLPLAGGRHPSTGDCRYNLSFRRAG
ncbi:MAG: DNA oxidative demethylase AlkB [Rhodocyclaceae bacterium]|nr:DNA oxidative demethylase AlkB [Rhodocyclaceae bacterium]